MTGVETAMLQPLLVMNTTYSKKRPVQLCSGYESGRIHGGMPGARRVCNPSGRHHFYALRVLFLLMSLPVTNAHGLGPRRARIHAFSPEAVLMVGIYEPEGRRIGGEPFL
jgi:hypothetical protein